LSWALGRGAVVTAALLAFMVLAAGIAFASLRLPVPGGGHDGYVAYKSRKNILVANDTRCGDGYKVAAKYQWSGIRDRVKVLVDRSCHNGPRNPRLDPPRRANGFLVRACRFRNGRAFHCTERLGTHK
jgi:hypothetical protein